MTSSTASSPATTTDVVSDDRLNGMHTQFLSERKLILRGHEINAMNYIMSWFCLFSMLSSISFFLECFSFYCKFLDNKNVT